MNSGSPCYGGVGSGGDDGGVGRGGRSGSFLPEPEVSLSVTSSPERLAQCGTYHMKKKPSPRRASTIKHTPPRNESDRSKSRCVSVMWGNSYTDQYAATQAMATSSSQHYDGCDDVDQIDTSGFRPEEYVKWEGGPGTHSPPYAPLGYSFGHNSYDGSNSNHSHPGRRYQQHPHHYHSFGGHHPNHGYHSNHPTIQFNPHKNNHYTNHNQYQPQLAPAHWFNHHHNHSAHNIPNGQMPYHPPSFMPNNYPRSQPTHHNHQLRNHPHHLPPPSGRSLNHNAHAWLPSNHSNVRSSSNAQPPVLHHRIHSINNNIHSRDTNTNTNQACASTQSTLVDHNTSNTTTTPELSSSSDFYAALHPGFQQMGGYVLIDCTVVHGGEDVGYLKPFNNAENRVLYSDPKNAMVPKYIPQSQNETTRKKNKGDDPNRRMRLHRYGAFIYENMRTLYCCANKMGCKCYGQIYRVQHGEEAGRPVAMLYYAKVNPNTDHLYEHTNHHAFPNTEHVNCKHNEFTLSAEQKQYVIDMSQGTMPSIGDRRNMVDDMIDSADIKTTPAQEDDAEKFLAKINEFINTSNRGRSSHKYFRKQQKEDNTTSDELYQMLMHLTSTEGSEERNRQFKLSDKAGQFMMSKEGKLVNKLLRVYDHNHDGITWSHITFEFLHAPQLAKLAVTMYDDGKLMLEMDFFMSVCDGNEWQVGHIGLSDRNHKYWILCVIIAKSENHSSARLLLNRAIGLLREAKGDGRSVLVDGGKALDKAIGIENEERLENVLEDIRTGGDMLAELQELTPTNVTTVQLCDRESSEIDAFCDEIFEAFIGQDNTNEGDVAGRIDLELRLTKLLKDFQLDLMRCLAHLIRNAGKRGAGWRGGKGSLCRALLSSGCPKKVMQKVRYIILVSSIVQTLFRLISILCLYLCSICKDSWHCIYDGLYSMW